jgi:hypothetical protein
MSTVNIEKWGKWHSQALSAGVDPRLAELGRRVVRDYWEHGKDQEERAGDGPFLGADRHHQMMIALAKQKPGLAKACFEFALGTGSPQEDELTEALSDAEWLYADNALPRASLEWNASAYALKGCSWDLYTEEDHKKFSQR